MKYIFIKIFAFILVITLLFVCVGCGNGNGGGKSETNAITKETLNYEIKRINEKSYIFFDSPEYVEQAIPRDTFGIRCAYVSFSSIESCRDAILNKKIDNEMIYMLYYRAPRDDIGIRVEVLDEFYVATYPDNVEIHAFWCYPDKGGSLSLVRTDGPQYAFYATAIGRSGYEDFVNQMKQSEEIYQGYNRVEKDGIVMHYAYMEYEAEGTKAYSMAYSIDNTYLKISNLLHDDPTEEWLLSFGVEKYPAYDSQVNG